MAPHPHPATLTWFRLGAFNPPVQIASSLDAIEPRMRLAGGCRYAMNGLAEAVPSSSSPVEALNTAIERRPVEFPHLLPVDRLAALPTDLAPGTAPLADVTSWKSEIASRAMPHGEPRKNGNEQTVSLCIGHLVAGSSRLQPLRWVSVPAFGS